MSASALPRAIPTRFGPRSEICSSFPGSQQPESPTFESLISEMAFGLPSAPVNSQSVFQTLAAEQPPWTRALGMMELGSPRRAAFAAPRSQPLPTAPLALGLPGDPAPSRFVTARVLPALKHSSCKNYAAAATPCTSDITLERSPASLGGWRARGGLTAAGICKKGQNFKRWKHRGQGPGGHRSLELTMSGGREAAARSQGSARACRV